MERKNAPDIWRKEPKTTNKKTYRNMTPAAGPNTPSDWRNVVPTSPLRSCPSWGSSHIGTAGRVSYSRLRWQYSECPTKAMASKGTMTPIERRVPSRMRSNPSNPITKSVVVSLPARSPSDTPFVTSTPSM